MTQKNILTVGLPDGKHIRSVTYDLFAMAGINIDDYHPKSPSRKYISTFALPSGAVCNGIRDKPRDLIYSVLSGDTDLVITGQDYVEDFSFFADKSSTRLPFDTQLKSAHLKLRHLGYFGTQLAFLAREDNPYNSLDELIKKSDKVECFSEFPMIAKNHIMESPAYKERYGNSTPHILSNLSVSGENDNVWIYYKHGATEAAAANNSEALILELLLTGKTADENNLRVLKKVGGRIFTQMYSKPDLISDAAIELVTLLENAVINHPDFVVQYK